MPAESDAVVVLEGESPLHGVALPPVPAGYLAQREVWVDGGAPFLLLGVSVHVNESDVHVIRRIVSVLDFVF